MNSVPDDYYGKQYWTDEMLETWGVGKEHPKREVIEKYLSRYGERVFCYELYHQVRKRMDEYFDQNPPRRRTSKICLQAELRKEQVRDVIEYFNIEQPLVKEYVPDFLLHSPGNFQHQKLIIEVKSVPELSFSAVKEDLSKIQEFIQRYRYRLGVFLAVNAPSKRIIGILARPASQKWIQRNLGNRRRILFISKERQDSDLIEFRLDQIPAPKRD